MYQRGNQRALLRTFAREHGKIFIEPPPAPPKIDIEKDQLKVEP